MNESRTLLAEYVKNGSESAFRDLVGRYVNLVHSTATRLVNGDAHLAEDITQTVFVRLARRAATLPPSVMIGGWLHRDTCLVASTTMRGERRRHFREQQAVAMNSPEDHTAANLASVAPILDEAINQLEAEDRAAILLRFFEQLEFRAVGQAIGSNEDAARMRVNRALDKLRTFLKNCGVTLSAAALGAGLAAEAVTAAPTTLATVAAGAALASVAASSTTVFVKLTTVTMTKLKTAAVGAALAIAALAVSALMQHQSVTRLRQENQALRQQAARLVPLQAELAHLSNPVLRANTTPPLAGKEARELARLRNEVTMLRAQTNGQVRPENSCINNLRLIDAAKNQWALEKGKFAGDTPTEEDIRPYIWGENRGKMPTCPDGGHYTIGRVGEKPTCSNPSPSGDDKQYFSYTTMKGFAQRIGFVLHAPVADQTGLAGMYNIVMTPLPIGPDNERLPRVAAILLDELGLQLVPLAGPFTGTVEMTNENGVVERSVLSFPADLMSNGVPMNVVTVRNESGIVEQRTVPVAYGDPIPGGFAIRLARSGAPGLKLETGEDFTAEDSTAASLPNVTVYRLAKNSPAIANSEAADGQPGESSLPPKVRSNLRLIAKAKENWALEFGKSFTAAPTWSDLKEYLGRRQGTSLDMSEWTNCNDGEYVIETVIRKPGFHARRSLSSAPNPEK